MPTWGSILMKATFLAALFAAIGTFAIATPASADETASFCSAMATTETTFVQNAQHDLTTRFPHASDAVAAGYVRYTAPDDTGAISYADKQWTSDPTHPSQLWYDTDGNLMGADYSVPRPNGEPRPQLWGIDPGRWYEFNGHVHYVVKDPQSGAYL